MKNKNTFNSNLNQSIGPSPSLPAGPHLSASDSGLCLDYVMVALLYFHFQYQCCYLIQRHKSKKKNKDLKNIWRKEENLKNCTQNRKNTFLHFTSCPSIDVVVAAAQMTSFSDWMGQRVLSIGGWGFVGWIKVPFFLYSFFLNWTFNPHFCDLLYCTSHQANCLHTDSLCNRIYRKPKQKSSRNNDD